MPQLADPSGIRSRPISVVLGELAIAAGLIGESVTIACGFPANTLCQIWKYHTQALSAGNVIHACERQFGVCIENIDRLGVLNSPTIATKAREGIVKIRRHQTFLRCKAIH